MNVGNASPAAPYISWPTAATSIQDAVDYAEGSSVAGCTVWVTNGMYETGSTLTPGSALYNRIVITKDIVVRSVNGPSVTIIKGAKATGVDNNAVRGVYMSAGLLFGFTITNGHAQITGNSGDVIFDESGGGVNMCAGKGVVKDCILLGNVSEYYGGGSYGGTLNDCTLSGNSGYDGGGAFGGTLNDCTLSGNTAIEGGGANNGILNSCTLSGNTAYNGGGSFDGTLNNCTLSGNSASEYGGGSSDDTLNNCTLSGNSANYGGGAGSSILNNCMLSSNTAVWSGGGASYCTVNNCTLSGNSAAHGGGTYNGTLNNCALSGNSANYGGGAFGGALYSCTLSGNTAYYRGGGSINGILNNCIVYFNTAGSLLTKNWDNSSFSFSCTTPLPDGVGNITDDPMLLGSLHIHGSSPCAGSGLSSSSSGNDIDGDDWSTPPSMGCDEPTAPFSGALQVSIMPGETNVVVGHELFFSAEVLGEAEDIGWDFSDGLVADNSSFDVAHSWSSAGIYPVVLTAWNTSNPAGVSATVTVHVVTADEYYVDVNNATPSAPYTSWADAATTIQDAVNIASAGALVRVAGGVYETGSSVTPGYVSLNRVVITKDILVRSEDGAESTIIKGAESSGGGNGADAVRGVYMSAGFLKGFTITNGYTMVTSNVYDSVGGGVNMFGGNGEVQECILVGNMADNGGGAYGGMLNDCILSGNVADNGGGVSYGTLNDCTLSGNSATDGGGSYDCIMNNCELSNNTSEDGGGGSTDGVLNNCTITGNSTLGSGGGCFGSTLNNCIISKNSSKDEGGGSKDGILNNCTITGNSTLGSGGGCLGGSLNNCIIYYNTAGIFGNNHWSDFFYYNITSMSNSCTTPLPPLGTGNITNAPLLISASHIAPASLCHGTGANAYSSGLDVDGELWLDPPSMGCDEYHGAGTVLGMLDVAMSGPTNFTVGYEANFMADIEGPLYMNRWDFGDGTIITNAVYPVHSWGSVGDYDIVLTGYSDSYPGGISATQRVHVIGMADSTIYVSATTGSDLNSGTNWTEAKQTIQGGVDAQNFLGGRVLVTNGLYDAGSAVTPDYLLLNRVVIAKKILVESVQGAKWTIIKGAPDPVTNENGTNAIRCVFLAPGAILTGFTMTNGYTQRIDDEFYEGAGGGCFANGATLNNCVLSGNRAYAGGGGAFGGTLNNCTLSGDSTTWNGGGVYGGILNNCMLRGNLAGNYGGGSYRSILNNCTLSGNSTIWNGGGVYGGILKNCIVWSNSVDIVIGEDSDISYTTNVQYSCSPDLGHGNFGNITNNPQFVDGPGGNVRLQTISPCIGMGNNGDVSGSTDLDGSPRIVNTIVDMGAYEYIHSVSNYDGDAFSNVEEQIADTDEADSDDYFHVTAISNGTVYFDSSNARWYTLLGCTNLLSCNWKPVQVSRWGVGGPDAFASTNNLTSEFYKLTVESP